MGQWSQRESGSSPHTRGAPLGPLHRRWAVRIIPAYAGSTADGALTQMSIGDHPRIRGEHYAAHKVAIEAGGSSPHTRGALCRHVVRVGHGGIIPAYAGSTLPSPRYPRRVQDHPRIRGEHMAAYRLDLMTHGSSPHTRGALELTSDCNSPGRDHPRIRGEHRLDIPWPQAMQGSSPHTRGAPTGSASPGAPPRIIPAYAGSTPGTPRRPFRRWDHPRIRGEHKCGSRLKTTNPGSSPHTRGARLWLVEIQLAARIIPAYAGSTRS